MDTAADEFREIVVAVLARFLRQNGEGVDPAAGARFAAQLWTTIETRGLPRPLPPGVPGAPGEVDKRELAELTQGALANVDAGERFADAARQIVKACFYPEFRVCRDSYRERSSKGGCKRQVLERARERVSGSHCVDCPYWTDVSPGRHAELLAEGWCGERAELEEHRGVFLPGDFRALRRWVRNAARRSAG